MLPGTSNNARTFWPGLKSRSTASTSHFSLIDFWVQLRLALAANSRALKSLVQKSETYWKKLINSVLLDNNFSLSNLRGALTVCPNTSSSGLIPETPVLTRVQQRVVDGYPHPNLSLFRNNRSSSCSLVFGVGAIFRELFDFEGVICRRPILCDSKLVHDFLKYARQNLNLEDLTV